MCSLYVPILCQVSHTVSLGYLCHDLHLKEADSSISIVKDREFVNSRKVLDGKARFLREHGYGKRSRASKAITTENEEMLWSKGALGSQFLKSLIVTICFVLTQHFGFGGFH